jgi:hypothetical protein
MDTLDKDYLLRWLRDHRRHLKGKGHLVSSETLELARIERIIDIIVALPEEVD